MPQFFVDANRTAFDAKKRTLPTEIYLPVNLGRATAKDTTDSVGSFLGATPSDSVNLWEWIEYKSAADPVTDVADLRTLSGTSDGDSTLGTFTGSTVADGETIKGAIQDLETAFEALTAPSYYADVVSTTNVTLSGEQTIDGVLTSASRVLLTGQTDTSENGVYTTAAGAWTRIPELNSAGEFTKGKLISVLSGTTYSDTVWMNQAAVETLETSGITISPLSATAIVLDTTPQLGGMLDVNGQAIGDGTNELIVFSETGSAVNEITITNAATAGAPSITASGDDTNIALNLDGKGTGDVTISDSNLAVTGNITVTGTVDTRDIADDGDAIDNLVTLSGVAKDATSVGTIDEGAIISDTTIVGALGELSVDLDAMRILSGVAAEAVDLGAIAGGNVVTDNSTILTAITELDVDLTALQTAVGINAEATHLGVFSGTTISDNQTAKAAIQALETALEVEENTGYISLTKVGAVADGNHDLFVIPAALNGLDIKRVDVAAASGAGTCDVQLTSGGDNVLTSALSISGTTAASSTGIADGGLATGELLIAVISSYSATLTDMAITVTYGPA